MFSRLFSVNFTRSIYTNSKKKFLMYDKSLRLAYVVSQNLKSGKHIQVLAPTKPNEINRSYKQRVGLHMSTELKRFGSIIDHAEKNMEDPKYATETYDTFVLHEPILGKKDDGATRPLEEMGPYIIRILKTAVTKLKATKEFHVALRRSEYNEICKVLNLDDEVSSDETLGLQLITKEDLDYVEDKKKIKGHHADDRMKLSLKVLKFKRVGDWHVPVAGSDEQVAADGPKIE